jgi:hypothetical protein
VRSDPLGMFVPLLKLNRISRCNLSTPTLYSACSCSDSQPRDHLSWIRFSFLFSHALKANVGIIFWNRPKVLRILSRFGMRSHYVISYRKYKTTTFWELIPYFPLIRHGSHRKWRANSSFIVLCVFVAAVTCLPSRCLATIGGYTDTQTDGRDL